MRQITLLILLLAGVAVTAWGQTIDQKKAYNTIGSTCLPFSAHEFHITPQPDTTIIYLHYADGGCDTIKAAPSTKKSKYRSEVSGLYTVALLAAQTQREAITIADLEAYLADSTTPMMVDTVLLWDSRYRAPIATRIKQKKTLNGFLQWLKRKEK